MRICADLGRSDGSVRAASQVISQQNEAFRIAEWQRTQEDTLDEREDSGGGSDAKSQSEHDGQTEARRFPQLAKCETEILCECVHAFFLTLEFRRQRRS